MPLPRFRIRTLMIAVAVVVSMACYGALRDNRSRELHRTHSFGERGCGPPIVDPIPGEPTWWDPSGYVR